ncbi:hypothetical protein PSEUBRA_003048 [Kalmanozyma brasiliensis GHG001]|uniref:uncharacterized protein n=1 Tax=Kalmanozyma brasiliensis (strain GHG001) TaxID=1365824 RepID=UPI002868105B|nr:uncharacterized protein PSEUBRA_003048 [Kalmanozyma brasiliensis GHG001]KAF6767173.1 hypothetical protein PSEUBRA_003048 [Kalmanozyma brasiliensis GHG001]
MMRLAFLTLALLLITTHAVMGESASSDAWADSPAASQQGTGSADEAYSPPTGYSFRSNDSWTRRSAKSVFGAGCRWDPTSSNIVEVSYTFRTGQAPPSTWFSHVGVPAAGSASDLRRRTAGSSPSSTSDDSLKSEDSTQEGSSESFDTSLIDVLTYRARYGSFGTSLNDAGCALPSISARLASLEAAERQLINNYTLQHKPLAGVDDTPNAMFFWAGLSNYNPSIRSDLIQTVVFYGDGCAADPRQGLCVYAAEYSAFRYDEKDHMCMGSNMPVFYPVETGMKVVYRTQRGFRTQEAWIDGKMVSYLRSAGDQVMNSFVITQECKGCQWPLTEQVYEGIRIRFSEKEEGFDGLGLCEGGATASTPRSEDGGKVWVIDEVRVPSGRHVTSQEGVGQASAAQG